MFDNVAVSSVTAGMNYVLVCTREGDVFCRCSDVDTSKTNLKDIVATSTSHHHCLALDSNGQVYSWGFNEDGQLGQGNKIDTDEIPRQIEAFKDTVIRDIATGNRFSLALSATGQVYSFGLIKTSHETSDIYAHNSIPTVFNMPGPGIFIHSIAAGSAHYLLLSRNGTVYAWGPGSVNGQVTALESPVSAIACGDHHSLALMKDTVYAFGKNTHGQLGFSPSQQGPQYHGPMPIEFADKKSAVEGFAAFGKTTIIACSDDRILVFGEGANDLGETENVIDFRMERKPKVVIPNSNNI
jgi:alpha-tubulin suppressor-like RCC1 family protein